VRACASGAAVGLLGGLIGLGGAEFRLPVLVHGFGFGLRAAIRLNLAMSLCTVTAALAIRCIVRRELAPPPELLGVVAGLAAGAVGGALVGSLVLSHVSDRGLRRAIQILLGALGALLVAEALVRLEPSGIGGGPVWRTSVATTAGVPIGMVSSLLGVAGGELIIPTLMFTFGAGIKSAGTASLMVSIPALMVGLCQSIVQTGLPPRSDVTGVLVPMALGSVLGAVTGGILATEVPGTVLKLLLGAVLIWSAFRMFHRAERHAESRV
jgi:uncharacterized membrane protein YfcA